MTIFEFQPFNNKEGNRLLTVKKDNNIIKSFQ